jgi:hypothetical protein
LCFLFKEGASSTDPGTPYVAKWMDENGNRRMREVPRPECCATYFQHSNIIDVLNHQRQKELRLEKFWVTTDGCFGFSPWYLEFVSLIAGMDTAFIWTAAIVTRTVS